MSDATRSLIWMLLSAFCFSAMAVVYKWLTLFLPSVQMMAFRNGAGLVFLVIWGRLTGRRRGIPGKPVLLIARAMLGTAAMLAYFTAVHRLDVADVVVLHKTAPFFVLMLAAWWLREPVTRGQLAAFGLALAGVFVVFRPGFAASGWVMTLPLVAALLSAAAHVLVRRLTSTDEAETIVEWFFFLSLFVLVPLSMRQGMKMPETAGQWAGITALGLLTATAQVAMTTAYRYAHAGETALYSYASIPFATVLAWLSFGEVPDPMTGVGAVLITCAAWMNFRRSGSMGAVEDVCPEDRSNDTITVQSENEGVTDVK